jgi:hypothetical protein
VDAFFEAIDSDDADRAKRLMKSARVDPETIGIVLCKMANGDEEL